MASQKEVVIAKWTEPLTNELISLLVVEIKKGNRTTSTYNKTGWNNIRVEFNKRTGLQFTLIQLKNRVNKLRKQYGSFKKLLSQSGFGWDHINNRIAVADESVWESHIKENKEWAKFRNDGFPQYPDLCIVFGNTYATGEYVIGNAQQVLSSEGDETDGDCGFDGGDGGFVGSDDGDGGADADTMGDPTELNEQSIDEGLFTSNMPTSAKRGKHNIDRTPNAKRRKNSKTKYFSTTCKVIRELIAFRTSQSTSASVTSNTPSPSSAPEDLYSIGAVMAIINGMTDLEQDLYNKVVKESVHNASWRKAFILALPERRRGVIESI